MEPNKPDPTEPVSRENGTSAEPSEPAEAGSAATEDPKTDAAVDDIVKKEGDEVLAAEDEAAEKAVVMQQGRWERFKNWWAAWWGSPKKRWGTIAGILVVLAVLFTLPFTRYNILGVVMKAPVTVSVVDSKTGTPVSGALVELSGQKAETEGDGKATLRVNTGSGELKVSKKYYTSSSVGELVALSGNNFKATLVATGRQVQVELVDKITGKPVSGGTISAGGAKAKSDTKGLATLVIPSGATTQNGTVSMNGYNDLQVVITANGNLAQNTFGLVPAGKLYFLSNLSGKIDVVKTNLDGTDRQTVLAGTGNEDPNNTSLLASRDWKYLALLSKRSGDNASVYLIDTTNGDKLTTVDQGNANFSFIGWSGDRFIYQVTRNTVSDWQPNKQALKSLDATTDQTLLLDQTQASGTAETDFAGQSFGSPYIIGDQVVYTKNWVSSFGATELNGKQAELDSIGADGSGHKVVKSFAPAAGFQGGNLATQLYEPGGLYVQFYDGSQYQFYDYDNGQLTADTSMTNDKFYGTPYPTYLLSPSGGSTFWTEQRDGKNTLFVGDEDGKDQKQIASLSDYSPYGWYTDNYLLIQKSNSELYIMPASGGTPLKITDYYRPAVSYNGYGGGYGGL